jgi:hypothetical protein
MSFGEALGKVLILRTGRGPGQGTGDDTARDIGLVFDNILGEAMVWAGESIYVEGNGMGRRVNLRRRYCLGGQWSRWPGAWIGTW